MNLTKYAGMQNPTEPLSHRMGFAQKLDRRLKSRGRDGVTVRVQRTELCGQHGLFTLAPLNACEREKLFRRWEQIYVAGSTS
jgi:hypothetical protein